MYLKELVGQKLLYDSFKQLIADTTCSTDQATAWSGLLHAVVHTVRLSMLSASILVAAYVLA